ncbi:MAG: anhydro-N-acetylmuramic acid kinase [Bacteroidales bacterium]|nr:anhydro-N-acetylmuramic acid kinase [Bacteroidales bacterium]
MTDKTKNTYRALGIMSGTSLDGIDIALCYFSFTKKKWQYSIEKATTVPYPDAWYRRLKQAHTLDACSFLLLHKEYGKYIGDQVNAFLENTKPPDLIASHGHTVFHTPTQGLTFQLGDGAVLAATCKNITVCDFRSYDIALGGQGAPLVPIGDELLFDEFDYCLNLGGFANISYRLSDRRIAYDICPVNCIINHLSHKIGLPFDTDGNTGRSGKIIESLLTTLNRIPYYLAPPPKSLSREWLEKIVMPLIDTCEHSIPDLIRTIYQHIVRQIAANISNDPARIMLVTGGGALNVFLMELIRESIRCKIVIPDNTIIKYKEALIFALLGVLRIRKEINCLASATGARRDSSSGIIYLNHAATCKQEIKR